MSNSSAFFLELNKKDNLVIINHTLLDGMPFENYATLALLKDKNNYQIIIKEKQNTVVLHLTGFELNNFLMNSLEMFKSNDTKFKVKDGKLPMKGKDYNEFPKRTAK